MRAWGRFLLGIAAVVLGLAASVGARAADAVVAADGSGQYRTIQEAINAVPQTTSAAQPWVIRVAPGTYEEVVYVQREKRFVRLVGDDAATTILSFGLYAGQLGLDGKPIGTFRTPTLQLDADDFTLENITVRNSAVRVGQALAIRVDGDRAVFRRCVFVGWQDTIFVNRGRQYFEACRIEGATDFIFGGATAWFEGCEIVCLGDGYITAASTPAEAPFGFVFNGGVIRATDPKVATYLGRPWRDHASTVFLRVEMGAVVKPAGWHNWGKPAREKTSRYREFANTGPGAATDARAPWAPALTPVEAERITVGRVLGGSDGWSPQRNPVP